MSSSAPYECFSFLFLFLFDNDFYSIIFVDSPSILHLEPNIAKLSCHCASLKGKLQGCAEIFKGLKMTFRTKILEKKLYHVNQRQKYCKLCFDNFSL